MLINKLDNVEVNLENGHKYSRQDIKSGENIIKYGQPIGHAICDINKGDHVHTHNMKTNLSGKLEYTYEPGEVMRDKIETDRTFMAYRRKDGNVGIRNDVWFIPTVDCVNSQAKVIAEKTGAKAFTHPFGCSQLGDDHTVTQLILKGLINHPNAGGITTLAERKPGWIDFDASPMLDGVDPTKDLLEYCIEVAEGKQPKNEINKCEEISIFKDGVIL